MIRLEFILFRQSLRCREIANRASIRPETLCRILSGKQNAGFNENQSAERIARAVGWKGSAEELFESIDPNNLGEQTRKDN